VSVRKLEIAAVGLICSAAAAELSFSVPTSGDYQAYGPVAGDNAGPAITALVHGNLSAYAAHQPLMGPVSLLLRAPATAVATALGGGQLSRYEAGAFACLLILAAAATWLIVAARPRRSWIMGGLAALALLSPLTRQAIELGHPEEPLTAVLVTAAVFAAIRGRDLLAAALLGVAIATKEWALIGVVPVLLALPARRVRAGLIAGGIAGALYAPGALMNFGAFTRAGHMLADKRIVNPFSIMWPLGSPLHVAGFVSRSVRLLPSGFTRERLVELGAVCAALLAAPVAIGYRRGVRIRDPLALLALLGFGRCMLDPLPQAYYFFAPIVPLAAWEVLSIRRLPLATLSLTAYAILIPGAAITLGSGPTNAITIAGAIVLGCYLLYRVFCDPATPPNGLPVTFSARWRSSSSRPASPTAPASPA
jgi:hypothetical protein